MNMFRTIPGILVILLSFTVAISMQSSQALLFDTRELTEQEKQIAEKDYLSIVQKCHGRLAAKEDSGDICDAFFSYYIKQCEALDNLLSYCDVEFTDKTYVNPVRDYEYTRYNQQGCIKQNQTFMDLVFCEDYINIPGEAERRFLKTLTNKSHLIIPSATLYTTNYNSEIFGEVMNNYTYPIEFTHILAGFNYTNGSAVDFDHAYTQDSYIKPGHKSGFWFFFENPLPKNTRFTLTSEFQRSNVSLPEKLLLTVTNPGNMMSNHTSIVTTDAIQAKDESATNIFNGNKSTATNESRPITNTTQSAIDEAQNILSTAANATANATGELMSRADNVLSLASDAASNATQTAMNKTMNILSNLSSNVSDTMSKASNNETGLAMNEEANELIDAASNPASNDTNATQTAMDEARIILGNVPTPANEGILTDFGEISGNITNLGNITATNVQINAIFYDASGKVVDIDSEYVNIGSGLLPGKSQSFSMQPLLNYEYREKVVSYLLNAESRVFTV